jgi:hypothetical protein
LAFYWIILTTIERALPPPLPFEDQHWADFPVNFNDRGTRRVRKYLDKIQFPMLRSQVYVLANTLHNNMQIQITNVELSTLFGHSGGWVQGMIARHSDSAKQ